MLNSGLGITENKLFIVTPTVDLFNTFINPYTFNKY